MFRSILQTLRLKWFLGLRAVLHVWVRSKVFPDPVHQSGINPDTPVCYVMDAYARKLTIKLNIDNLQEDRIRKLKETMTAHKGDHALNFVVYEMTEEIKVNLISRKQKVQISSELLTSLEAADVHYKLN